MCRFFKSGSVYVWLCVCMVVFKCGFCIVWVSVCVGV